MGSTELIKLELTEGDSPEVSDDTPMFNPYIFLINVNFRTSVKNLVHHVFCITILLGGGGKGGG